jgi:hypothetical protein
MPPFLMTLASDADHWLFITSNGALTAGRGNPDRALFPYYTQDKIEELSGTSGSRTVIRVEDGQGGTRVWEPFSKGGPRNPDIERHIQKNELGNHVILEEAHHGLGLRIRIGWRPSGRFGFVRKVELENTGNAARSLHVLDGLQNVLPCGLSQRFQNEFSILGDAYKKVDLEPRANIGLYHLSSVPTDLAVPMESLRANIAWQSGLEEGTILISDRQLQDFRDGTEVHPETSCRGRRGAFLSAARIDLEAGAPKNWYTCADIEQDASQVEALVQTLAESGDLAGDIEKDCRRTEDNLLKMLAEADGLQCTAEPKRAMRHLSNTLFNLMRGGALVTGYELPVGDVLATVAHFNRDAARSLEEVLGENTSLTAYAPWEPDNALSGINKDALRLIREYLPLSFSRRHGDPSRPWNRFSIEIKSADGSPRFYYQGNWRDIFQNWETLLHSYPEYIEAAICRFLNASTADGYNPYRLTKDGYEWEVMEPADEWANIGYWGDHQIIYLLRLLEASARFNPGRLGARLDDETHVYAEIPYRIRSFEEILKDPRNTVDYDEAWEQRIEERVQQIGADGKLMPGSRGGPLTVTLLEKLLAPLMAKLSNFIPGGGIWMNTQRPEWNDANNALVGYGISVVTLGYVARYLRFLITEFGELLSAQEFHLSTEIAELLESQAEVFAEAPVECAPSERLHTMEALGKPASAFRKGLYDNGLSGNKQPVEGARIVEYLKAALHQVEHSLRANQREDKLWHSYNLLKLQPDEADIARLTVMLEGQVAILSAGILNSGQTLELLESLRKSPLYREDQDSYILYPNRDMPAFMDKNRVNADAVRAIPLLEQLHKDNNTAIIKPMPDGSFIFNGSFHNKGDLDIALRKLGHHKAYAEAVKRDREKILELFETAFNHHAFTGRSGTFFAYEGLGSIYWHMVSKLVLAVEELIPEAEVAGKPALIDHFRHLRDGLGVDKNPRLYGAFPTDAYSHTPAHAGAQQPGMTGQVKEDILIRQTELGVSVREGRIHFRTDLVEPGEFLNEPATLSLPRISGTVEPLQVPAGSLAYTVCQVPVLYFSGKAAPATRLILDDNSTVDCPDNTIPQNWSREIFRRTGKVQRIEVDLG